MKTILGLVPKHQPSIEIKKMYKFSSLSTVLQIPFLYIFFVISGLLLFVTISTSVVASIDVYDFDNDVQEQQYRRLIDEFRCPKCQNQNLASSDSGIAEDLKRKTHQMVKEGKSDKQIRMFMVERYGDFVTYNPPVRPSTYILWYVPPILLLLSMVGWFGWSVNNNRKYISKSKYLNNIDINTLAEIEDDADATKKDSEVNNQIDSYTNNDIQKDIKSDASNSNIDTLKKDVLTKSQLTEAEQIKLDSILNQFSKQDSHQDSHKESNQKILQVKTDDKKC